MSNFLLFQSVSSLTWVKEKCETYAQKLVEAVQAHNNISEKYNELKASSNHMKNENAHLTRKLKESEVALSTQEVEFKKVESKAKYYEDKSTSIELFTTVKVHAKMLKEYTEGKLSSWDPKAAFPAWEKMKTLYSGSDEEGDQQKVKPAGSSGSDPSGARDGVSGSGATGEEVVVDDVAK